MSSASYYTRSVGWDDERRLDKTHRGLPVAHTTLIVRVGAGAGEEVAPLGDVLLSLLSPNFDLLLLATAPELVLLQAALALVLCRWARISGDRIQIADKDASNRGLHTPFLRCAARESMMVVVGGKDVEWQREASTRKRHPNQATRQRS